MPEQFCQRVIVPPDHTDITSSMFDPKTGEYNEFHVADHCGDRTCNKPAKFRSRTYDGTELWLCAECFDEFEATYGVGSFEDDDDVTEPAGVYTTEVYEEDEDEE